MTQSPAGWYPDPSAPAGRPFLRYWDGSAWTEHRTPVPAPAYAPHGPAGPTTPDGVPLAGWWWRVLAYLIDGLILSVPALLVALPDLGRLIDLFREQVDAGATGSATVDAQIRALTDTITLHQLVVAVLALVYFAGMLRWKGATLGHFAVGLRVRLREVPGRMPWSGICVRVLLLNGLGMLPSVLTAAGLHLAASLIGLPVLLFTLLNLLWPLWDDKRQALHDKAAGTNVVKVR